MTRILRSLLGFTAVTVMGVLVWCIAGIERTMQPGRSLLLAAASSGMYWMILIPFLQRRFDMFAWWNNLPSTIKDLVRLVVVMILQQIIAAVQSPPTVSVTTPAPVVNVAPAPVLFSGQPPATTK